MLAIPIQLPDLWQQEAVRALREGYDVIIDAPTGAGKTRVFEIYAGNGRGVPGGQAVYTVPTRALANDKWQEWRSLGWNAGIATGDLAENLNAPILVATLETQRERIIANNSPALLVVDEYQLIADAKRGLNYELALAMPPASTQFLLLSGSVRNPADLEAWLGRLGRRTRLIRVAERPVPLDDFPIQELPNVPAKITGFWPRVAAGAIASGMAPLLIFAPRRREAEQIARQIAAALPVRDPLRLEADEGIRIDGDMVRMLQKRVAFHHSGLSYAIRAGLVEKLGKSGQLDVIVATTGLAAGINFSVRSVAVASVEYSDGPFRRELRPDELLQMFGRAGRRGLDERGFVLYDTNRPRLFDAAPRQIRRINQLDWPTLLRVMEAAAADGGNPLERAADLITRLFSPQKLSLGLGTLTAAAAPEHLGPTRREVFTPQGVWVDARLTMLEDCKLGDCRIFHKDRWSAALRSPAVAGKFGPGRVCKLQQEKSFVYGKEVVLASLSKSGHWKIAASVQRPADFPREATAEEIRELLLPFLLERWAPAAIHDIVERGTQLSVRLDLSAFAVRATVCSDGPLLDPPRRQVAIRSGTSLRSVDGTLWNPPPGSTAHSLRRLGLLNEDGSPTLRGQVVSRFQSGEGLVIAAALEAGNYPTTLIVRHLANLRGGHRFSDFADGPSQRLSLASREAYGHIDVEGYLEVGLCPGYGEGTFEALEAYKDSGLSAVCAKTGEISRGDLERAYLEWQSLLRHILHASPLLHPRWPDLVRSASEVIKTGISRTMPRRDSSSWIAADEGVICVFGKKEL